MSWGWIMKYGLKAAMARAAGSSSPPRGPAMAFPQQIVDHHQPADAQQR
jgi:hypothetical protein